MVLLVLLHFEKPYIKIYKMAENKQNKTNRELFSERMSSKYPDKTFADDEALYGQAGEDYDKYETELNGYKEREGKLNEMFEKDPRSAQFITDMAKGTDPWIAVIERIGIDGISDIMNDPEKKEEYAEANKKYMERLTQEKGYEEEYNANLEESTKMLDKIQAERGLSDEEIDGAMEKLMGIVSDAIKGKFSEETIDLVMKAISHDADVENANTEGRIAGRNERIEEKLRKDKSGDGMPTLAGSNNTPSRKSGSRSMFDLAGEAR